MRLLRWSLPAGAATIVALYVVSILNTVGWVDGLPQIDIPQIIPENLTMDNPRYEGFNSDGGTYVVTAKTAVQDLADMSHVKLNGIVGDLSDANKVKTNLKATRGLYNTKTNEMELFDGIDVVSESGMQARLSRATVITKENIVISKEPVVVTIPAGTIRSKGLTMRNKSREVTFSDSVVARLVPDAGKQDGGKDKAPAKQPAAGATPIISAANGPIDVTSNRLDIDDKGKVATFSGGVRAAQGDAVLETSALEVYYEGGGTGAATSTAAGKIKRIASREPVVMTRAPQDRVTGQSLDFDAVNEIAQLTGDVVMTSGEDRRVTSSAATMNQRSDTILLTGDVVAVQGRNEMKGGRLYLDRATGAPSSPPRKGSVPKSRAASRRASTGAISRGRSPRTVKRRRARRWPRACSKPIPALPSTWRPTGWTSTIVPGSPCSRAACTPCRATSWCARPRCARTTPVRRASPSRPTRTPSRSLRSSRASRRAARCS